MSERHQVQFATSAPVCFTFAKRSLRSFDHRHDGFNLCSFSITLFVESGLHQSSISSFCGLVGRPSVFGRDDGPECQFLPCELMVRFTVVTCIGENGFEFDSRRSLLNQQRSLGKSNSKPSMGDRSWRSASNSPVESVSGSSCSCHIDDDSGQKNVCVQKPRFVQQSIYNAETVYILRRKQPNFQQSGRPKATFQRHFNAALGTGC